MKQAYIVKAYRTAVGKAPKGVFSLFLLPSGNMNIDVPSFTTFFISLNKNSNDKKVLTNDAFCRKIR